jgi:hypothetical protein
MESRIYPLFVYSGILILSVIILLTMMFFEKKYEIFEKNKNIIHIIVSFIICIICVNISEIVGFYTSMLICIFLVILYIGICIYNIHINIKELIKICVISLLIVIFEYVCFTCILQMDPPAGIFM